MEKSKSKKKVRAHKAPMKVTGRLAMPKELLPWERDLLAVLLKAVDGSVQRKKTDIEVPS